MTWDGIDVKPVLPDPRVIGLKRNGLDQKGNVYAYPSPGDWLTQAIGVEFAIAGLRLMEAGKHPRLHILVEQFFTEPVFTRTWPYIISVLALEVRVTLPVSGKTYVRHFAHYANQHGLVSESNLEECTVQVTRQTLREFANELRRFLESTT